MTLTDDQAAAHADARQAAYFRVELNAERLVLQVEIGKRRALIDRPSDAARRQRSSVKSAEAELRYLSAGPSVVGISVAERVCPRYAS
jgi:hypothetical protein